MNRISLFWITFIFSAFQIANGQSFIALLQGTAGNEGALGNLTFTPGAQTEATLLVCGLPANSVHGIHIHQFGDISSTSGVATGGHFNPYNVNHGCYPGPRHVGDIGNFTTDGNGCASETFIVEQASFDPSDTGFVLGRGVIVHSTFDDCVTQPTGNAGGRMMQGVIGLKYNYDITPGLGQAAPVPRAIAILTSASMSTVQGMAIFTPNLTAGVDIEIYATGLAPLSTHGIHIHQFGDITSTDGSAAGPHFNPYGVAHGCYPNGHSGDLINGVADSNGIIHITFTRTNISLSVDAINSILGRAVIIHALLDDCTGTSGNAGARVAQGVIGITQVVVRPVAAVYLDSPTPSVKGTFGFATLTIVNNGLTPGVNVNIQLENGPPNLILGFHIHQYGDITSTDGMATGGHYNPLNVPHGCITDAVRHVGDLGNITTDANGDTNMNIFSSLLSLDPNQANSYIIGRGLIIHSQFDSCVQPTGNAGSRIYQGVIGYAEGSATIPGTGAAVNPNVQAVCRMRDNALGISGNITITPNDVGGVKVYFYVSGLTPNSFYGIHIHTFGDVYNGAVGGHFNPFNVSHACPPSTRHVGDMGNFRSNSNGDILALFSNDLASLSANDPASIIGRSIVIHQSSDDCVSQPSGNAGNKLVYCAIGYTQVATRYDPTTPQPTVTPTPTSSSSTTLISVSLILFSLFTLFAI